MRVPRTRVRRPRLTYANVASTLALVLAMSMGGAYAHGKIGSAQIKQNAVKFRHIGWHQVTNGDLAKRAVSTNRIKARAVTNGKLAPGARGAKVVQYLAGGHSFSSGSNSYVSVKLPGSWTTSKIRASTWMVHLVEGQFAHLAPGKVYGGDYAVATVVSGGDGYIRVIYAGGTELSFDAIRITRILRTSSSGVAATCPGLAEC